VDDRRSVFSFSAPENPGTDRRPLSPRPEGQALSAALDVLDEEPEVLLDAPVSFEPSDDDPPEAPEAELLDELA
jgi:hypothetical protein